LNTNFSCTQTTDGKTSRNSASQVDEIVFHRQLVPAFLLLPQLRIPRSPSRLEELRLADQSPLNRGLAMAKLVVRDLLRPQTFPVSGANNTPRSMSAPTRFYRQSPLARIPGTLGRPYSYLNQAREPITREDVFGDAAEARVGRPR
jgi:hypothetical protein